MKLLAILTILVFLLVPSVLGAGLEITEVDVHVSYDEAYTYRLEDRNRIDSTTVSLVNGSRIDADVLPGSNVTFTIRVENTLNDDIRGAFVTINLEDIDDGADLEQDSIDFDLEPGNDERVDIEFTIPLNVEAGTYNVNVEATGDSRNETVHVAEFNFELEVKKQSHDIRITKVGLIPGIVDCDRKAKLTAEIMNLGSNLENEIALEFKASILGINSYDRDITLESSNEAADEEKIHVKTLNIEVPDFFKEGTFPIFINLYWKNFILFDQKTVDLVVRDCASFPAVEEEEQSSNEEVIVIPPKETVHAGQDNQTGIVTRTRESSILSSPLLLLAASLGVIVIAFIIIVLVLHFRN